jgi:hypothetical protein
VASNILLAVAIVVFGSLLVAFGAMAVVAGARCVVRLFRGLRSRG